MLSLRSKIVGLLVITITTTVVILGAMSYALMVESLLSLQEHNLEHFAVTSANEIGRNMKDLQESFANILTGRGMQRGSDLPMAKYLSRHQDRFPELSLLNKEGHEELRMVRERIMDPEGLRDLGGSDLFRKAMSNPNEVIISSVVYSQELGESVITFALANVKYFGDEFQSLLIGSIPVQSILATIDKSTYGGEGFISIVDDEQRILYAPDASLIFTPLSRVLPQGDSSLLKSIFTKSPGLFEGRIFGQEAYVSSWTDPVTNWTVMSILPTDVFMLKPNRLRKTTLFICLGLLMGGAIVAYRAATHLTRDVGHLIENTHRVASGDLSNRVTVTSRDEIALLGASFNEMTDQLERSKEARDRLDTILQSIIDPLLVTDNLGRIQRCNNAALEMLQHSQESLMGTFLEQIFPERLKADSDLSFLELVQKSSIINYETYVTSKGGRNIPVLLSGSYVRTSEEQEAGLVVVLKDISTRKAIEEALNVALAEAEETRDQVNAILRSVVDGLVVTDMSQKIVHMNRAAEKLFGVALHDVLNKPLKDLITEYAVLDYLQRQIDNPKSEEDIEFELNLSPEKTPYIIQARSAPVQSKDGLTSALITTLRNVTDERKVERMKNEFISTAAHELNTPISTIMGFSEILIDRETYGHFSNEQRHEFLTEIFDKSDVLARIVRDLLDVSRMETGQAMPLEKTPTNINETVIKATHCYQATSLSHQLVLNLDETATTKVLIDQQRIIQVIENLVNNATKYSPTGSSISINTKLNCDYLQVSIADQGVGMTKEQTEKMFDKFYRADASNTSVSGLGMGMSIVKNIVYSHGGTIEVSSDPGVGTTVTFGLPIQPSQQDS